MSADFARALYEVGRQQCAVLERHAVLLEAADDDTGALFRALIETGIGSEQTLQQHIDAPTLQRCLSARGWHPSPARLALLMARYDLQRVGSIDFFAFRSRLLKSRSFVACTGTCSTNKRVGVAKAALTDELVSIFLAELEIELFLHQCIRVALQRASARNVGDNLAIHSLFSALDRTACGSIASADFLHAMSALHRSADDADTSARIWEAAYVCLDADGDDIFSVGQWVR